jgi:hypothetical protein
VRAKAAKVIEDVRLLAPSFFQGIGQHGKSGGVEVAAGSSRCS